MRSHLLNARARGLFCVCVSLVMYVAIRVCDHYVVLLFCMFVYGYVALFSDFCMPDHADILFIVPYFPVRVLCHLHSYYPRAIILLIFFHFLYHW